ncbi:MAG: hypothetical protein IT289_11820 [Oligoflexia bacterium]|nr:hypothetical protein [Oligoflexia bacterium]
MDSLKELVERLLETIKSAASAQMESPWVIKIREKFEELPPIGQSAILWGAGALVSLLIMWWPLSDLMTSWDLNSQFEEKRQSLKDLLKIQRDLAQAPQISFPPSPSGLKSMMDQKVAAAGIRPDQIREGSELPPVNQFGTDMRTFQYRFEKITIRQAVEVAYEIEHVDASFRLQGISMKSHASDSHYYDVTMKVVNFAPRMAQVSQPGGAIVDALKKAAPNGSDGVE